MKKSTSLYNKIFVENKKKIYFLQKKKNFNSSIFFKLKKEKVSKSFLINFNE